MARKMLFAECLHFVSTDVRCDGLDEESRFESSIVAQVSALGGKEIPDSENLSSSCRLTLLFLYYTTSAIAFALVNAFKRELVKDARLKVLLTFTIDVSSEQG